MNKSKINNFYNLEIMLKNKTKLEMKLKINNLLINNNNGKHFKILKMNYINNN